MTKDEKKEFVQNFITSVLEHLQKKIEKLPEDWSGFEMRHWIAAEFQSETRPMDRSRTMKFNRERASL